MTEPQVWVLIGVFAAAVFGMMSWQTASFNRNLRISVDSLDRSLSGGLLALDRRLDSVEKRLDSVEKRLDSVESKIDGLDRDVQALTRHVFGPDGR